MDIEVYRRGSPGTIRPHAAAFFDDYVDHVSRGLGIDDLRLSELVSARQGYAVPQSRELPARREELDAALAAFASGECDGVLAQMVGIRDGERWMFEPGVEFNGLDADAMGKVEATIYRHPVDPASVDTAAVWADEELRALIDRFQPVYGRIGTGGAAGWWEKVRTGDRYPLAPFEDVADSKIRSPDWTIYLTEHHLAAVNLDDLAEVAASIEPYAEGAIVKWTEQFSTMSEDAITAWIGVLDPILW